MLVSVSLSAAVISFIANVSSSPLSILGLHPGGFAGVTEQGILAVEGEGWRPWATRLTPGTENRPRFNGAEVFGHRRGRAEYAAARPLVQQTPAGQ